MAILHIHNELKRGCGFRKPGGLYLRTDGTGTPCGKLPIPLERCPCCGRGIKQGRGWTWIDLAALLEGRKCGRRNPSLAESIEVNHCGTCALDGGLQEFKKTGLLWIGRAFYKTPLDWLNEARLQGVSRRISTVPHGFEIGKTWVAVAHPIGAQVACPECRGACRVQTISGEQDCQRCKLGHIDSRGVIDVAGVFHVFKPSRVEYIVKGTESEQDIDRLEKRGIQPVRLTWDKPHNERTLTNEGAEA